MKTKFFQITAFVALATVSVAALAAGDCCGDLVDCCLQMLNCCF
jgi:hypothetical protein